MTFRRDRRAGGLGLGGAGWTTASGFAACYRGAESAGSAVDAEHVVLLLRLEELPDDVHE